MCDERERELWGLIVVRRVVVGCFDFGFGFQIWCLGAPSTFSLSKGYFSHICNQAREN